MMTHNKKVKFLLTVDVETYYIKDKILPFDINIYGKINGSEYGVGKIMELCNDYNVKGIFFVDVFEHYKFGSDVFKELCKKIDNSGHSVQLHVHTNFIPGKQQGFIKSYDFLTQKEIIGEGKNLIENWIGKAPLAFRAGSYGANLETISALEENGFLMDSSYFVHNKNCALSYELLNTYSNKLFMIKNILEVPVTVYNLFNLFFWKKNSKIDINACSFSELNNVIRKIIKSGNGLDIVVLFLHSFSFIHWNNSFSKVSIDYKAIDRFNGILDLIINKHKGVAEFIRLDEIDKSYVDNIRNNSLSADYVPQVNIPFLIPRLFKRFQ